MNRAIDHHRRRAMGGAAFIIVATFLAYLPAMRGEFLWDDDQHVSQNTLLRSGEGLKLIWTARGATPQYYPLTHTSFWLEYQIWGANPTPYHITNVLLHVCSALLLWRILAMLELRAAFLAASIFALHPIEVESVAWISERKNVLSAFLHLCAMWSYLSASSVGQRSAPSWIGYALSLVSFIGAVLSKSAVGTLPAAILLIFWWKTGRILWRHAVYLAPMLIVAIVAGANTAWMEREFVGAVGPEWSFSWLERLAIAGKAIAFYAWKIIAPLNLTFIYPKWDVNVATMWPWVVGVVLMVAGLFMQRGRIGRGPVTAVLFLIGTLVPALGFANVYPMRFSFVADHFQYLAGIGLIVLVTEGLVRFMDRAELSRHWLLAIPVGLALLTFQQSKMYANPLALWQTTIERNPGAWIAHDHLGALASDPEVGIGHYMTAITLEPGHIEGYGGLGALFQRLGRPGDGIQQYRKAIEVRPDKPAPYYWLAGAQASMNDVQGAVETYEKALEVDPKFIPARWRLIELYTRLGRRDDAARHQLEAQRQANRLLGR